MTGSELRRRREALGLSQSQVAGLIDPDSDPTWRRGLVYRWERFGTRELPGAVGALLEIHLSALEKLPARKVKAKAS